MELIYLAVRIYDGVDQTDDFHVTHPPDFFFFWISFIRLVHDFLEPKYIGQYTQQAEPDIARSQLTVLVFWHVEGDICMACRGII